MKRLILATFLGLLSMNGQGATPPLSPLICHDLFTFVPMKFTLEDDGVNGPILQFKGLLVSSIAHNLGLPTTGARITDLKLTLSGQPAKTIHRTDTTIRQYTSFGLTKASVLTFLDDTGKETSRNVTFASLDIQKSIAAAREDSYSIHLVLRHSGKIWSTTKNYYAPACH